jgi:hypothetical protein
LAVLFGATSGAEMKTVYKYRLPLDEAFTIDLPRAAQLLSIQVQDGDAVLYALVDTEFESVSVEFRQVLTGQALPDVALNYIGSYRFRLDGLVYHIFEVIGHVEAD